MNKLIVSSNYRCSHISSYELNERLIRSPRIYQQPETMIKYKTYIHTSASLWGVLRMIMLPRRMSKHEQPNRAEPTSQSEKENLKFGGLGGQ